VYLHITNLLKQTWHQQDGEENGNKKNMSTFNSKILRQGERRVRRLCGDAGESGGQYGAGPGCILSILFNP
jgi:hypothetical protein